MSVAPYPEYKYSGVEWIGELPTSWNIKPLKHLANFINGEAFKPTEWSDEGTPIIRIQNLNGGDDFNYFQGEIGPVTVLCRSFDHILCSKGDEP